MNLRTLPVMLGVLMACATFAAEDYNAIFEKAVDAVVFDFDRNWAYTETRVDREHVRVARYDPRRASGARWQLLSIDGRSPTEKETRTFQKEKKNDRSDNNRVEAMVEPGSIRLIGEDGDHWLLGFYPGEEENEFRDSLDATIRINKAAGHLEYIDLRTRSAFRPATGVKIAKLLTRLTFGPAVEGGPVVPLSTQVEVKGRAYLFINFDEQELSRNSDFEFVGEQS